MHSSPGKATAVGIDHRRCVAENPLLVPPEGVTLGVLADTHVPDRKQQLAPVVLRIFREANVSAILHAGDITSRRVLHTLENIAPVYAVRGNRDWVALGKLPFECILNIAGIRLALTHGHGRWWEYLRDRVVYLFAGYKPEIFQARLLENYSSAQVIIFGHTHRALNQWVDGKLLFNPGTPHRLQTNQTPPSVGLLHIGATGAVESKIVLLDSVEPKSS